MYYKYLGSGQQLQVFRADGGYKPIPAEDLSAEEAAAAGAPEYELLGSGLYEAVEGDKPGPVPAPAPLSPQDQLAALRTQAGILLLQIAALETEHGADSGEQASDSDQVAPGDSAASDVQAAAGDEAAVAADTAPVTKRKPRGGAE